MKKYYLIVALFFVGAAQAQIINIPDVNFKNYLLTELLLDTDNNMLADSTIDLNNNGEIEQSEALLINELYVNGLNIASLEGVEYFTNLVRLRFNDNQVTSVDLHTLNQLQHIQCFNNLLTSISLCGTPATSLWAEGNPNLTYISVKNNVISQHDLTRSTSENTPPGLPSFMFPESLQTLCYDTGVYDAVSFVDPISDLITDCESECSVLAVENPVDMPVISIAPNPAVSFLEVKSKSAVLSVSVFNSLGQLVKKQLTADNTYSSTQDLMDLGTGTYWIEVVTLQGKAAKTFIKL